MIYCRYRGQNPQPAHLEIRRDGHAWGFNPNVGRGVPEDVWNGRRLWIACTPFLTAAQTAELSRDLAREIAKVQAGLGERWDGSNMVGTLTDDAQSALDAIESHLIDLDNEGELQVWAIDDWISDPIVRAELVDRVLDGAALTAVADDVRAEAVAEGCDVLEGDVDDFLAWLLAARRADP